MKCKKCGEDLPENAIFCRNCGHKIEESLAHKYRVPIALIAVVLLGLLLTAGTYLFLTNSAYQDVQVGTETFEIPGNFKENINDSKIENDSGIITITKSWHDDYDVITITEMFSSTGYADANKVLSQIGGQKKNMLGQTGFMRQDNGIYSFSYVRHNALITIYTTNITLFDSIKIE